MKLYLYLFIYLFGWLIQKHCHLFNWLILMYALKKQTIQIMKLKQMYNVFVKRNDILFNGFYLNLCVGLWEVLKDDPQFAADPLTIKLLCIALEMNMALQHLACCYYTSINWTHLFSLTLIIIPFSRLQFRQPFGKQECVVQPSIIPIQNESQLWKRSSFKWANLTSQIPESFIYFHLM